MADNHSKESHATRRGGAPLAVAIAVACIGGFSLLIADYGPRNKPKLQTAAEAHYSTTGDAARAAGATVMPTEPKPRLEPDAPGPKPVQPANPVRSGDN